MQGEQGNSYQRIGQKLAYLHTRNANTSKKNKNYVPGTLKANESPGSKIHKERQSQKYPQIIARSLPLVAPMY